MATPAPDSQPPVERARPGKLRWVKWAVGIVLLTVLVVEGFVLWPQLHNSWQQVAELHWGWAAAAIFAEIVSFSSFARIQKQLLHAGGVEISQRRSLAVIYASNSMSVTLPAGQVFSTAFTYRATRRWGATPIVASWQLAISGVIGAAGLALLGFGGVLLGFGTISPYTLVLPVAGVIVLAWAVNYAAKHPEVIERIAHWLVARFNRIRGHADEEGIDKIGAILEQLTSVRLTKRDALLTLIWTIGHRIGDVACLGFCCYAVGAQPQWTGIAFAFAFGKALGAAPLLPAGLGYVDTALIFWLSAVAGMPAFQAAAGAVVYRMISFVLVAVVGWVVFFLLFRKVQAEHSELDAAIDAELEK